MDNGDIKYDEVNLFCYSYDLYFDLCRYFFILFKQI